MLLMEAPMKFDPISVLGCAGLIAFWLIVISLLTLLF
jgi:hypothetical protein